MKKKIKEKKEIELLQVAFMRAITMKIGKSGIVCWKFEKNLREAARHLVTTQIPFIVGFKKCQVQRRFPLYFFYALKLADKLRDLEDPSC